MSISDRLDQIEQRATRVGSPIPGTGNAIEAYNIARTDVPGLVAAVRAVLDLHPKSPGQRWVGFPRADLQEHYCMADQQAWPCDTHRAIATALGEETP